MSISPADLSAARNAALQQRANTQLGREVRQSATGATTDRPGDAVTLSGDPQAKTKAAETNATHMGLVKNDTKGSGDAASATGAEQPAEEKTGYEPIAKGPTPQGGPSLDFSQGGPGSSLPLGSLPSSQAGAPTEPLPSPSPGGPVSGSSERKDFAQAASQAQAEEDQVRQIFMQMWADRRKAMAEMWKIIQDTNTKVFEIIQGVAVNRAMSVQKSIDAWTQYIMM